MEFDSLSALSAHLMEAAGVDARGALRAALNAPNPDSRPGTSLAGAPLAPPNVGWRTDALLTPFGPSRHRSKVRAHSQDFQEF
jgi:hypothetical protein